MYISLIIPVYNRPDEIDELLGSLSKQAFDQDYEIVIIEDGSTIDCKFIIKKYQNLNISYIYKPNSGPGDSRNFGMQHAKGNYFIILDSDCVLPQDYLFQVQNSLKTNYVDCFGGVDTSEDNFTDIQKAINFAMTSVITTGGIRGGSETLGKFQPRSFNMGISKEAFLASGGFGNIHPGEDPDLSIRLWNLNYETRLFKNVKVFHKRRISWDKFKTQVYKFGKARVILNKWHPNQAKLTYFFPSLFIIGLLVSIFLTILDIEIFLNIYLFYFVVCFIIASLQYKSLIIGILSVWAVLIQFFGYGKGFIEAYFNIFIMKKSPEQAHPEMFFKN